MSCMVFHGYLDFCEDVRKAGGWGRGKYFWIKIKCV